MLPKGRCKSVNTRKGRTIPHYIKIFIVLLPTKLAHICCDLFLFDIDIDLAKALALSYIAMDASSALSVNCNIPDRDMQCVPVQNLCVQFLLLEFPHLSVSAIS